MQNQAQEMQRRGALQGLRILDLSTVVAGPFASTLLADFGAEVLKVELPGTGDSLRALAPHKDGVPLWWKVANRNKRGITLDFRREESRDVFARLVASHDVLVENFRPGTLAGWGYGAEWLHGINPRLTILRITGFGQTGPYRNKPGFARVLEAMSGFTNICGAPDGPPMHMGFPVADALAGMFGAIGILCAIHEIRENPQAHGQEIDCSLLESTLRILDFLPIEYDQLGVVRQRSGNFSQYAAPGNVYRTRDQKWASIAASTQSIYERLCRALGRQDLIADPQFLSNPLRVQNREILDGIIAQEVGRHTLEELSAILTRNEVGFSPIFDIADVFRDPHIAARNAIVRVQDEELGVIRMQGAVPVLSRTPGRVESAGPALGEHTEDVLAALGFGEQDRLHLKALGVI